MRLEVGGEITILEATDQQKAIITKGLSLINPTYAVMKRQGNIRALYATPEFIKYYRKSGDDLIVGRGVLPRLTRHFSDSIDKININLLGVKIKYLTINKQIELRDYQFGISEKILQHNEGIIKLSTGYGKSIIALKLIEQTFLRTLIVVPRLNLLKQFQSDIKTFFDYDCGIINGQTCDVKDITVATIQTLKKRDLGSLRYEFGMVIFDECFDGDTLIDTPKGKIKIKDIIVGDIVNNAEGIGCVNNIFCKRCSTILKINIDNNYILVTPNHRFFTSHGWINAGDIKINCRVLKTEFINDIMSLDTKSLMNIYGEDLRIMWKDIHSKKKVNMFRRLSIQINNGEKEAESLRFYQEEIRKESKLLQRNEVENRGMGEEPSREFQEVIGSYEVDESNAYAWSKRKNEGEFKTYGVQTKNKRRKWSGDANTSKNTFSRPWAWLVGRILYSVKIFKNYISRIEPTNKLQNRHSKQKINDSYRSGWLFPLFTKETVSRQEKRESIIFSRVESVEIQKPRNNDELRNGFKVYNIEVDNHPSYSVNGLLVHNCHTTISDQGMRVVSSFNPLRLYGMTATPDRSDGQGEAIKFTFGDIIIDKELPQAKPTVEIVRCTEEYFGDTYANIVDLQSENESRNKMIAGLIKKEMADNRKILVLTKRTKHYEKLFSLLGERPGIFMIKSKLSAAETKIKDELLEKLRTGSADFNVILGTFSLLSTGINIPALDTIVLAGDLKSSVLCTQSVGRILRLFLGKKQPKIIDIDDFNSGILHNQARLRKNFYKFNGWEIL